MPRVVDMDQRRHDIADAAWTIAAQEGIAAVTYRRIAHELGASTTVATLAFPNREALLREVFQLRINEWIENLNALGTEEFPSATARLERLLLFACPTTAAELDDARVWIATMGPQTDRDEWLAVTREFGRQFAERIVAALDDLGADPDLVYPLSALVWGLNAAAVEDPEKWSAERVRWSVQVMLASLGLDGRPVVGPLAVRSV